MYGLWMFFDNPGTERMRTLKKKKLYKVGELAKICDVNPRTIDYYTTKGLIVTFNRTDGNYRLYDETAVERIKLIHEMKEHKFSLDEIKTRLDSIYGETNDTVLTKQLASIINDLELLQRNLTSITPALQKAKGSGINPGLKDQLEQLLSRDQSLIKTLESVLQRFG